MKTKWRIQIEEWGYWIARLGLGAAFIHAAVLKIGSPREFANNIAAYRILPFSLINLLAWGLPWFELVCGILVLTGFFLRIGALGALALLAVFVVAVSDGHKS